MIATSAWAQVTGQIVNCPTEGAFLCEYQGDGIMIAGVGDPEGWLHLGTRQGDGTRSGGTQGSDVTKIVASGANGMYVMAVRSNGGDGASDENPWITYTDPTSGVDSDITDQWNGWFDDLCAADVIVHFFLYDDGANPYGAGDTVGTDEGNFIDAIVNAFEAQTCIVWVVAEEYDSAFSVARAAAIAARIATADDNDHPIGVHHSNGDAYAFSAYSDITVYLKQEINSSIADVNSEVVSSFNSAAGNWVVNLAESHDGNSTTHWSAGSERRQVFWATAMGGGYHLMHEMDIAGTSTSDLEDAGRVVEFFNYTDFETMNPDNARINGDTDYVLENGTNDSLILYADAGTGNLGVTGAAAGTYDLYWYDPVDGDTVTQEDQSLSAGTNSWSRPSGIGAEAALWIVDELPAAPASDVSATGTQVSGASIQ